jgi:hypothetical protein
MNMISMLLTWYRPNQGPTKKNGENPRQRANESWNSTRKDDILKLESISHELFMKNANRLILLLEALTVLEASDLLSVKFSEVHSV